MTTLEPTAASTTAGATPQPGWYPDPQNPAGALDRWWNGAGWSEHTRRRGSTPLAATAPAPAATTARASLILHNGPAWWSLGFGLLSLVLAVGVLVSDAQYVWLSTSGVFAVLNGVRALRLRSAGLASAFAAPIVGMVAGAIGSILMLVLLLTPVQPLDSGPAGSSYDGSAATTPL
ncbi:MAG TPA: DUF2510 domain-containing protein [Amnibacterium sp.]|jgi:hypothetical protein